jgi:hypothetical protein
MTVVLLHDLGDPVGGARWRSAAPPDWIIPDLPGHGVTPATLAGVGHNAHAALVVAAGGDCERLVIVDGLWGPWRGPADEVDAFYTMIRAIAADPAATAPPPATGLDSRASYGYGVMSSARFARRFWGTVDQPVLAIETPRSTTPRDERGTRAAWFGGPTTLVELDEGDPVAVVDAIQSWSAIS